MLLPIRYSKRAKRMFLQVHEGGRWEVVVPARRLPSEQVVKAFVDKHQGWIERQVGRASRRQPKMNLSHQGVAKEVVEHQTLRLIESTVLRMRRVHPVTIDCIRLGNYKAQWGSCSSGMTIGFHYKLSLLPEHLAQYIVAHELAHTTHFNHSKDFWALVERLHPGAKTCRKELRQYAL